MRKVASMLVLIILITLTSTVYGFRPPNYYELSPQEKIEVLIETGYSDYDLDKIGKTTALPILHSLISKYATTDEKKAGTIVRMLRYFHDESSIDPLMQAWEKNKKLEKEIIDAVGSIYYENNHSDKAYQAMIKLIKADRYDYGDEFLEGSLLNKRLFDNLVYEADKSKVPYLIEFLKDEYMPGMPLEIIKKLGDIGDPEVVVSVIAEILKHEFSERRRVAAETLGKIGSSLAITPLKDAVKVEKEMGVKMDMAAQLVKLGEFLYFEDILKVLEDPKWSNFSDVKEIAVHWLKEASGQDFGEDAVAWRKWFEDEKARRG